MSLSPMTEDECAVAVRAVEGGLVDDELREVMSKSDGDYDAFWPVYVERLSEKLSTLLGRRVDAFGPIDDAFDHCINPSAFHESLRERGDELR